MQLVETAIVLPVLLLLLAATAEFGRYFYTYSALSRGTLIGARYLAGNLLNSTKQTEAINLSLCGQTAACNSSNVIVPGLQANNVAIITTGLSSTLPETVTLQITYTGYRPVFALNRWIGGSWSGLTMIARTTMRYQLEN